MPDPNGGTFDAAGDFDRLLEFHEELPAWSSIDPYGDTVMDGERAIELPSFSGLVLGGLRA